MGSMDPMLSNGRFHSLVILPSHGENGPFIDGLPIKNGEFPWQTVK
jgi:hypothetical protein